MDKIITVEHIMAMLNFSQRALLLFIFAFNCLYVSAKVKFMPIADESSLSKEFFIEGFFDLDMLPVAIIDTIMNSTLDTVLPMLMKLIKNSFLIFDTMTNVNIKSSFLIFVETNNLEEIHEIILGINCMFRENWSRTLFWFLEPISMQTENFILVQCTKYLISPIVIISPLSNHSAFKFLSTNNVLNIENNFLHFTFNQINVKYVVRKVIQNVKRLNWNFDGATLRVKAHPKYVMLHPGKRRGLFGVDALALRRMLRTLNFKVELVMGIKNHFGNTFPNGSLVSSIADLKSHKIDLNMNRHVLISRPEVMLLPVLDTEEFCFILPHFRGYFTVTSITRYLTPYTWAMVLLSVMSSTLAWRLFNIISKSDDYPVLSLLQSFLTAKIFKISRPFHMVFLTSWFIFVFILMSIFRGVVLKSIIKPFWVDEITNMEQLLQSNLKIKNRIGIFQVAPPNSTLEKLLNRSTVSHLIETDFEFRTSAYFTSKYFRFFLNVALGSNDQYYTIPDCLSDRFVSYFAAPRSPYYNGLQQQVIYLQQYGFYNAWFKYFSQKSNVLEEGEESFYFGNSSTNEKKRPLTLQDLLFAFYIETVGFFLSSVVFLCEVMLKTQNEYVIPFVV